MRRPPFRPPFRRALRRAWTALALAAGLATALAACAARPPFTYTAPDGGFRAVFPQAPTRSVATSAGSPVPEVTYRATARGEDVGVVFTHSGLPPTPATLGPALDAALSAEATEFSGTVASKADVSVAGHPGRDAVITRPGAIVRARVVFVGNGFYDLYGGASSTGAPHPAYDRLLETFTLLP